MADGRSRNLRLYAQDNAPSQPSAEDDPLVELARIVSEDGGFYRTRPVRDSQPQPAEPARQPFSPDVEAELLQELELSVAPARRDAPRRARRDETSRGQRPAAEDPVSGRRPADIPGAVTVTHGRGWHDAAAGQGRPASSAAVPQTLAPRLDQTALDAASDMWSLHHGGLRGSVPDDSEVASPRAAKSAPERRSRVEHTQPDALDRSETYEDLEDTFSREFEAVHAGRLEDEVDEPADAPEPYLTQDETADRSRSATRAARRPARSKRGLLVLAGVLGLVALGGGAAAIMATSDRGGDDGPIPVIRADEGAVKILPEVRRADADAGDRTVFDRVAGDPPGAEETLVERAEEPRDVASVVPPPVQDAADPTLDRTQGQAAGPDKIEERISSAGANGADSAFTPIGPRRVRTITIGPDGSVVQPTEPAEPARAADVPQPVTVHTVPIRPPGVDTADAAGLARPDEAGGPFEVASLDAQTGDPAVGTLPRARPADSLVANAADDAVRVAALDAPAQAEPEAVVPAQAAAPAESAPAAAPADGFVVQVSSQRSAGQAEQALDGLKQRFPSLLSEQRTDIQRADLGDKGTYYRVRVGPMASRADAVRLCEKLKAAGGSCFVTR